MPWSLAFLVTLCFHMYDSYASRSTGNYTLRQLMIDVTLDKRPPDLTIFNPYPWHGMLQYYFQDIEKRVLDLVSLSCRNRTFVASNNKIILPPNDSVIYISSFPPSKDIYTWWRNIPRPHMMRVEPYLCQEVYEKRRPIFFNKGCQLPHYMNPFAPRCQTKYLRWICEDAQRNISDTRTQPSFILPESDHRTAVTPPTPWILTVQNALVSLCGTILTKCGFIHSTANCMATGNKYTAIKFQDSCRVPESPDRLQDLNLCNNDAPYGSEVAYHDRLFVVAEVDDSYIYHIHLEIMPRLIYHLDFLTKNPDVMILIGCDTKPSKELTDSGLRHMLQSIRPLMDLAGLSMERLIVHRHVYAREVYFPMEGACQDPIYNTWQILNMRKYFMTKVYSDEIKFDHMRINSIRDSKSSELPIMMLMKRSVGSKHTRNNQDLVRQWSDSFTSNLLDELRKEFKNNFKIILFSDRNFTMMKCHECQMKVFYDASVVIGVHGAGLANMLYMKPNSAVIEFAPYGNDGRCLLGGGPFSRLASLMGHNYMMHHPRYQEYVWMPDKTSEFNITRFVNHIKSFMLSIQFMKSKELR